jgi:PEP-CTERM/exosortase A-associated glycosyltransferase
MNVLHVLDHSVPLFSGYSFRSRSIVRFQQGLGLRPIVVTSCKHGSETAGIEVLEGISYHRTARTAPRAPIVRELQQMARLYARIVQVARAAQPRILHAHSPVLNGLPALWAGRRLRVPVVYEARAFWEDAAVDHGTTRQGSLRYRLSRGLESWLFRKVDRVVTICQGMGQDIIERGVDPARVAVVPNGVDVDWFKPQPPKEQVARDLGLEGGPVFGFVGSFYHYEGLPFLLEAFPALKRQLPEARLLLVGSGEDEAALRAAAKGLGSAVIFAGQVPHERVRDFYSVVDVFVCPRRRMRLTELVTPLKPLEAMAMGRPVLASDVGGLAELIEDDVTGLLFRAESAQSLVAQAARLGRDAALQRRLGAGARTHVERDRSWGRIVSRYLDVYRDLGAEGRA